MLRSILKYEWRNLVADKAIWVVTGLFALLIGYGLLNGFAWVRFQNATLATARSEEVTRFNKLKASLTAIEQGQEKFTGDAFADPRQARTVGNNKGTRYAAMPPGALAPLAVGQSDLYPYYFKVSTLNKQTFLYNNELENPTNLLVGRFDFAFVIVYLYPLLILALSYNLISAERDEGTLAMLLAQPVALRQIVLGKILLRGGIVLALAVVCSLLGAVLSGANLLEGDTALRLGLWCAVVLFYGAFWFALAAAVNALGKSSATNAVGLVGLWLVFVVVIPAALNVTVTSLSPVPSRVELIQAIREASSAATAQGNQLLARYYEDHPELLPKNTKVDTSSFALRSTAVRETVDKAIAPVMARYDRQLLGQQNLVERYRFLSPAIVAQEALSDLAGTGLDRYRHFLGEVDKFHRGWQGFFVPLIFRQQSITAADIDRLPIFRFQEEPVGAVAGRVAGGLLGLVLPVVFLVWIALPRFKHYPVTA